MGNYNHLNKNRQNVGAKKLERFSSYFVSLSYSAFEKQRKTGLGDIFNYSHNKAKPKMLWVGLLIGRAWSCKAEMKKY